MGGDPRTAQQQSAQCASESSQVRAQIEQGEMSVQHTISHVSLGSTDTGHGQNQSSDGHAPANGQEGGTKSIRDGQLHGKIRA